MKIAVVTIDGKKVGQHFGRSPYYSIFTIEDGIVLEHEVRVRKTGHFAPNQEHTHHEHDHSQEHGTSEEHIKKHDEMAQEISDCQILIAGGMGRGAYERFFENGINVIMTDKVDINDAIKNYLDGNLINLYIERTH
jgi:predicted Fe-Mo cluster-binding NifX family protein